MTKTDLCAVHSREIDRFSDVTDSLTESVINIYVHVVLMMLQSVHMFFNEQVNKNKIRRILLDETEYVKYCWDI